MTATQPSRGLTRSYLVVSTLTLVLAALATGVGLFVPGFYRDAEVPLPRCTGRIC